MNIDTFNKLQYKDLKELVKQYCVSGLGKDLIDKLNPISDINVVNKRLMETTEGRNILDAYSHVPLEGVFNLNPIIEKLKKDIILNPNDLETLSNFLRGCRTIKRFMKDKESYAPNLSSYSNSITELLFIEDEINRCIRGNRVDSQATKVLQKIRRNIDIVEGKIKDKLNKFLNSSENKKYIQEFFISKRNDRYVIPVKSSYKHQVDGVVIEASSKGSSVFIEPQGVAVLNVELATLKAEEKEEEYQILCHLTSIAYDNLKVISINVETVAQYDMVFAKAKYSKAIDGICPKINCNGYINIIKGRHPLLKGEVVPLDFKIGEDYRTLVITGPNAGGKTVVLKTLGLLTLAAQSGFHVKAVSGTELSVFKKVFVDIGDNQSIENSLSTFSSHVKNIGDIMKVSNNSTLLLFDEIGSGTEPNEGAALAIAILEEFYHMGCITIASTHYGEIKEFAESHEEFINASMTFNKDTLEPLYKLVIGEAGESNALFISRKMGIRERVILKAKNYLETKDYNTELVKRSKININKEENTTPKEEEKYYSYKVGDKVKVLDHNDYGIVYEEIDSLNNLKIFFRGRVITVNYKRLKLEIKGEDLYPAGYDITTMFTSYKDRKLERDLERGSKKALKKIRKEIKNKN